MWCKTDGEEEGREPNGDVRIEGNSGSDGKGEWSEMVWHVLRRDDGHFLRKALGVSSEGQEEVRTTKEDMEDPSGKGGQGCWIGEKGCHESSEMESGS